MTAHPASDFISSSAAICDAVLHLRGSALTDELGRIARRLLESPFGVFVPVGHLSKEVEIGSGELFPDSAQGLRQEIACDGQMYGHYQV